jgi:uncharacterized protein (TIGR00661 family)
MKILYGVVGEGMGHAMRSAVILERLTKSGHEIRIVVSGRAADYLEKRYPGQVTKITGLTMVYEDNVVRKMKTAFKNLKAAAGIPDNLRSYLDMARSFTPDAVISDFESWTYAFARGQKLPVVSVDNMQIIDRCTHEAADFAEEKGSFLLAKSIVKAKEPRANAYLVTTFFYPEVRKERTTLHPPILRDIILDAKPRAKPGAHVLVYQSGASHDTLLEALKRVDAPFRVYGLKRDITGEESDGNLTHCPFSETRFIDDLAGARAVIAGGGFTLLGEAVFLGKPTLSVPLVGQFEQALNAIYLQKLGYGERANDVTTEVVTGFLARAPRYAEKLESFQHDRNEGLFARLEAALGEAVAEGARF